jgi:lipopolysaccharide/colanic/teichoic acid biosynthesis glycosyltransferase
MSTLIASFGTLRQRDPHTSTKTAISQYPAASDAGRGLLIALPEHSSLHDENGHVALADTDRASTGVALPAGPDVGRHQSEEADRIAVPPPGDDFLSGPEVSEAEPDYLRGLDFEDALIRRSRALGMVPLDFLKWDPELIDHALIEPKPRYFMLLKRLVDITGSLIIGLLVLPLIPFIALAIKLDSPGPVIYSQTRLGQGGRPFQVYKFRSMCADADVRGEVYSTPGDPRITRVGCFIRKTRIDELPQLWNVLKGDMSLIGPRPERPEMLAKIQEIAPEFSLRTAVKPGLTGWAQTRYHYAGTADELRRKLEYDLYYIEFDDIRMENLIALRTIRAILVGEGR